MREFEYEVNIGGGVASGSVIVSDTATVDEIKLAIIDDLYDVTYTEIKR